jgi:hypothetical protein
MVSGGFRPEASQNNPFSVSGNGGNGQSGKFVAKKVAKATQLRPSGFAQGENRAMAEQISAGGNVASTANAANPASDMPTAPMGADISSMLGGIEPLDSEPREYRPISDGVDFGDGRGSEVIPNSLNPDNRTIENVDLVKRYLPDLLNAARIPGAPDSYKRMINALMREIM